MLHFISDYTVDVKYEKNGTYTFYIEDKMFAVSCSVSHSDPSILQCTVDKKTFQVRAISTEEKIHLFTKVCICIILLLLFYFL